VDPEKQGDELEGRSETKGGKEEGKKRPLLLRFLKSENLVNSHKKRKKSKLTKRTLPYSRH
jgi:hypothetical protein